MTKFIKWIPIGFMAALLVLFAHLFLTRLVNLNEEEAFTPEYHLRIIVKDIATSFYLQFEEGLRAAEEIYDLYIEIEEIERWEPASLQNHAVDAIYSGVDAVALQLSRPDQMQELCELAGERGVELLIYESEKFEEVPVILVGTSFYSLGAAAGQMALDAGDEACRAIVILDRIQGESEDVNQSQRIQAIQDLFADTEGAEIVKVLSLESGVMAGEVLADDLTVCEDDYNTIICFHERTTLFIAQRLEEGSLPATIRLIGYGELLQSLDYIKQGILYGSISVNAYDIGYKTAETIYKQLKYGRAEDYLSDDIYTIDKTNVDHYYREEEKED